MIRYIEILLNDKYRDFPIVTTIRANLNEKVVFEGSEYIVMRIENNLDIRSIEIFLQKL